MLFLEDHIRAIKPALEARREHCDAMVVAMSATELVRLTRLGPFRMDQPQTGPLALIKKLRGKQDPKSMNASSGAKQMAMLRRLPKILRLIPGKAQDVLARAAKIISPTRTAEGHTIYRARFGLFAEREARDVCSRLTERGQTCFAAVQTR